MRSKVFHKKAFKQSEKNSKIFTFLINIKDNLLSIADKSLMQRQLIAILHKILDKSFITSNLFWKG